MKHIVIVSLICLFGQFGLFAQDGFIRIPPHDNDSEPPQIVSAGGAFDVIHDRFGNKYWLSDLRTDEVVNGTVKAVSIPCSTGYFDLFFEPGSGMESLTNPIHIQRREVLCQVFSDISNLINSPLTVAGNNNKVKILIRNIQSDPFPGALGYASSFYTGPTNTNPENCDIIDNLIWKTIIGGVDAYTNVAYPVMSSNPNGVLPSFYHGLIAFDFNYPWNLDLDLNPCPVGQYDFYTVALHEVLHAMGFASLIGDDGLSRFGPNFNYYGRYDLFLKNNSQSESLIVNQGCNLLYGYQYNPAFPDNSDVNPDNCTGGGSDLTLCNHAAKYVSTLNANIPIYTPACYENGSSLSHFEDMHFPICGINDINNPQNNAYFNMSNANPPGGAAGTKRHPTIEERNVLCDIGYSTNTTYGEAPNLFNYTGATVCPSVGVVGVNDGLTSNGSYQFFTEIGQMISLTGSDILSNDVVVGSTNPPSSFTCLEAITDPNAVLNVTSGNGTTTLEYTSNVSGIHLLKYIPVDGNLSGNITYLYIYVNMLVNCTPTACSGLITNSGFELTDAECYSVLPNPIYTGTDNTMECWITYTQSPDVVPFTNQITNSNCPGQPFANSWNSSNYALMLGGATGVSYHESIQQVLSSSIQPGIEYTLTFRARKPSYSTNTALGIKFSEGSLPWNIGYGTNESLFNQPQLASVGLDQIPLINMTLWAYYSVNFVYSGTLDLNNIILYPKVIDPNSFVNTPSISHTLQARINLDDISLFPSNQVASLNLPTNICYNGTLQNLMDYLGTAPPNGIFTGPGVSYNNGIYSFSASAATAVNSNNFGLHVINYTYTDHLGCEHTIGHNIYVIFGAPNFPNFGPFCQGTNFVLPTTSVNGITGTWSPAFNNMATETYTFTPDPGQMACDLYQAQRTIVISPNIEPNFSQIGPFCQGGGFIVLPTTAPNGVAGYWSQFGVNTNNAGTLTLTFTSVCGAQQIMNIEILPSITPTFTQVGPYCAGALIPPLPTTSQNGFSGTWSPAINNQQTTTYTFTPDAGQGECVSNATLIIEIPPNQPSFAVVGPYCAGTLIPTLPTTSQNGFTGTWSPAINNQQTTTYTFTPNPGQCVIETTMTIEINGTTPTFNSFPPQCAGSQIPALPTTSQNGFTGTWSPAINNQQTTTYTFTPDPGQCAFETEMTIEVFPTSTPTFYPISTLCQNVSLSLPTTSTNGISGTWSPAFSSENLGSTTYTFTPNYPCSPTTTMSITIIPCGDCNNAPGLHLSGEISGVLAPGQYRIVGDIDITSSAIWNDCVFAIDPNRTITVHGDNPGNLLMVFNSHFYGCHALWNGIDVKENGRLRMSSSLIEDAKVAINMQEITQQTNVVRLVASEVIFNKNITGLKINGYPFENPNAVFNLYGNVFTSRAITDDPDDWPSAADFAVANPQANINNAHNPFINAINYPASNTFLQMNIDGTTTFLGGFGFGPTGMLISNVGTTEFVTFNGLQIGQVNNIRPELFDRMLKGIDVQNSNLMVNFATFQAGYDITHSRGITANAWTNPNFEINIQAAVNKPIQFYNLNRAVEVFNYTHFVANNLRIRSNRSSVGHALGTDGIYWKSYRTAVFETRNNQIHNIKNGIHTFVFKHNALGISMNISNNTIAKNLPSLNGVVPDLAIRVNGLSNNSMDVPYPELTRNISGNNIWNVKNGIEIAQFHGNYIFVNSNNITIVPYPGSNEHYYSGIRFWNVSTARSVAQYNNITGFSHITGNSKGIQFDNASAVRVSCNVTDNLRAGLYFNGNCMGGVTNNTMSRHKYGLWLNGGGVIGQQGNSQWPSGNKWTGAWTNYGGNVSGIGISAMIRTFVSSGTNANFSRLFVNPELVTNPLNSWVFNDNSIPYSSSPMITITNFYLLSNPCATMLILENENEIDEETAIRLVEGLEQVADASMQNPQDAPSEVIKEQLTYDHVYYDEQLRDSVQVLDDFYYDKLDENIGKLRAMEDKIEEHDFVAAESLGNLVFADNIVEQGSKEVLNLYLKHEQGLFDTNDSLDLLMWAHSCYNLYGKAVLMAQILYNTMHNTSILFEEDCPSSLPRSASLESSHEIVLELFPNPNSDVLYISSSEESVSDATIIIKDLEGKLVFQGDINFEKGLDLNDVSLSYGVYIVELSFEYDNIHQSHRKKLVYLK